MWRETVAQSTAPPSPCCTQGKWTFLCICYLLYTPPVSHCRPPAFISGISCTPPAFISGTLLYIFGGLFMYSLLPPSLLNFQIDFSCAISYMLLCYSSIAISNSTFDLSHQTAVSCQLYKVSVRNVHTAHRQWLPWKEFDSCQTLQPGMKQLQKDLPLRLNGTQDHPVQCACKHCSIFTRLPVGWWETRFKWLCIKVPFDSLDQWCCSWSNILVSQYLWYLRVPADRG